MTNVRTLRAVVFVLAVIGGTLGVNVNLLGGEVTSGGHPNVPPASSGTETNTGTPKDLMGKFVAAVLGATEDQWTDIFKAAGIVYRKPILVLYSGSTHSACGLAQSAIGPFYCPDDQRLYLDMSFFREIETGFRGCETGTCQFAQAYVIAHEIGHHVQNLLGILPKAEKLRVKMNKLQASQLDVRIELQADCLAGVWTKRSQQKWKFLEPGDIDAAMQAASAAGDDMLQKQAQGYVSPDSFTHGTAEQRKKWFMTGLTTGTIKSCNTFGAGEL